jgi:hypothetical protein
MSEESKTAEGDYVAMGSGNKAGRFGGPKPASNLNLDDPNLSQEEKDHRLAIALQQQENAAAYNEHHAKQKEHERTNDLRTARSGTYTKLAAVRAKDHGMLTVPAEYSTENAYKKDSHVSTYSAPNGGFAPPSRNADSQEIADYKLAAALQGVEQVEAGTVQTMQEIVHEDESFEDAQNRRTKYSNYHIPRTGSKGM